MIEMLPPPPPPATRAEFRVLTPQEVQTLEPIFVSAGAVLPDSTYATFVGAVEDGSVKAFLVLQAKLHAEPMYIEPGYSHLFTQLVKTAEDVIITSCPTGAWVYLFAPAGRVSQLAATVGMQTEPYVVMSKLVAPDTPIKPPVSLTPKVEPEPMPIQDTEVPLEQLSDVEQLRALMSQDTAYTDTEDSSELRT